MHFRSERSLKHVPFTAVEWKKVQACYLMDDIKSLKESCDILNMWMCRMGSSTPVFIIISELIHRSLVLDKREDCNHLENADLALIYGSAIIRFINYVNECCQPKHGSKNLSIAEAVIKMSIPGWIVNLRHDATHNNMPPLTMLRKALMFCRNWLWTEYWKRQFSEAIFEMPKEVCEEERSKKDSAVKSKIYDAFEKYNKWRRVERLQTEIGSDEREQVPFKQLIDNMTDYPEEFVHSFVEICLSKQVNYTKRAKRLSGGPLLSSAKKVETISCNEQMYYSPIVRLLNDKGLLPSLLLELTRQIIDESLGVAIRSHLSGWADMLLKAFVQEGSPRFADTIPDESWKVILKHIVLAPQFFQSVQIDKVLSFMNGKIPAKSLRRLQKLLNIGLGSGCDEDLDVSTYSVKTLADLQNNLDSTADTTFVKDPLTGEEDWSISAPEELGVLGLTSKQTAESLCLCLEPSETEIL